VFSVNINSREKSVPLIKLEGCEAFELDIERLIDRPPLAELLEDPVIRLDFFLF